MAYLLDTDILSATRRREMNKNLVTWLSSINPQHCYLSVVTIGEVERGIERQKVVNPPFAKDLAAWLETVLQYYGEHILPLSTAIARRWGKLSGQLGHANADLMIAATALEHDLVVVTRNVRHFEPTEVSVFNPYEYGT